MFYNKQFPDSRSIARLQPICGDETFDRYHYGLDETIANKVNCKCLDAQRTQ
jgi:hypothetical protein